MDPPTDTTLEQIESYFSSLEEFLSSSLTSVAPDMPHLREIAQRIWDDLTRFGPPALPGLGSFEIPASPPPPPPPPPSIWSDGIAHWMKGNKVWAAGVGAAALGAGLLVGYGVVTYRRYIVLTRKREAIKDRREVVVVLGADHPVGLPLVLGLEAQGYIVIASVSNQEAVESIESRAKGYVRVLIFDPSEPSTVPYFLRSLQTALSLRFPTTAHGDPYLSSTAALSIRPYIHSLISLLSLFPAQIPSPIEALSLTDSYLPFLMRTHVTPFRVIQSLLPLFRRSPRTLAEGRIRKSIIICVPVMAARVGVAFGGEEAMATAATVRGVEILRRELKACAAQNAKDGVIAPKVVLAELGVFATFRHHSPAVDPAAMTQSWPPCERMAYGMALVANLDIANASPRKPTRVGVLVDAIVGVVSGGTRGRGYGYGYKTEFSMEGAGRFFLGAWGRLRTWMRGERFGIGAGAATYSLASHLPPRVLDFLLHIPQGFASAFQCIRGRQPQVAGTRDGPESGPPLSSRDSSRLIEDVPKDSATIASDMESSDAASEGDVESASGVSESGVALTDSWVSLKENSSEGQSQSQAGKEL